MLGITGAFALWTFARRSPFHFALVIFVCFSHIALVVLSFYSFRPQPPIPFRPGKLVVKTMPMLEEKRPSKTEKKKGKEKPSQQKKKKPPKQKKTSSTQKKERASSPSPQEKQREKLLAQVRESIAKIPQNAHNQSPEPSSFSEEIPRPIEQLQSQHVEKATQGELRSEESYFSELVAQLMLALQLPEHGDVQLRLTLTKEGKVVQVDIVDARSIKNQRYVEKELPHLLFPPFGDFFPDKQKHTFLITLTSQI